MALVRTISLTQLQQTMNTNRRDCFEIGWSHAGLTAMDGCVRKDVIIGQSCGTAEGHAENRRDWHHDTLAQVTDEPTQ